MNVPNRGGGSLATERATVARPFDVWGAKADTQDVKTQTRDENFMVMVDDGTSVSLGCCVVKAGGEQKRFAKRVAVSRDTTTWWGEI